MTRDAIPPTVTKDRIGACDEHEVFDHPAFATIMLSHPTSSGRQKLFGSDVGHFGCVRIEIRRAQMHRNLSRDWLYPHGDTVAVFEMTHSQFGEFISAAGRGEGTPVTLVRAPSTPALPIPEIAEVATKQDMMRREIRQSLTERLTALREGTKRLEELIENGKLSKTALREIVKDLKRQVEQAPGSLDFVLKSAEEALENATANARTEVEAFVSAKAHSLGLKSLSELAAAASTPSLPGTEATED